MKFSLEGVELDRYTKWYRVHKKCEKPTAIGGALTFSFCPTSIGCIVTVKCCCGNVEDLTDYDAW